MVDNVPPEIALPVSGIAFLVWLIIRAVQKRAERKAQG
jgi:hypothetical protein